MKKKIIRKLRRAYQIELHTLQPDDPIFNDIKPKIARMSKGMEIEKVEGAFFISIDTVLLCVIDYQSSKPLLFFTAECPATAAVKIFDTVYDVCSTRPVIAGTFYVRSSENDMFFDQDAHELFILDQASQMVDAQIKTSAIVNTNYLLQLIEKTDINVVN